MYVSKTCVQVQNNEGGSEYHLALLHTAVAGTMRGGGGGGDVAVGVSIWHCYTQL